MSTIFSQFWMSMARSHRWLPSAVCTELRGWSVFIVEQGRYSWGRLRQMQSAYSVMKQQSLLSLSAENILRGPFINDVMLFLAILTLSHLASSHARWPFYHTHTHTHARTHARTQFMGFRTYPSKSSTLIWKNAGQSFIKMRLQCTVVAKWSKSCRNGTKFLVCKTIESKILSVNAILLN